MELVRATKIRSESIVWNPAITPGTQAERRLRALRGHGLLRALGALRICTLLLTLRTLLRGLLARLV
jgi:hypothetical protein